MKRSFLPVAVVLAIAGCAAPADEQYCSSFGFPTGHPEYVKCMGYFHEQQALFDADRQVCDMEADGVYPPSLYSRPMSYPVRVYSGYGRGYGAFGHTEMVHVGADYQQNAELDRLRMARIIQPCMHQRGWVSGQSWQAGRVPKTTKAGGTATMPWLKK